MGSGLRLYHLRCTKRGTTIQRQHSIFLDSRIRSPRYSLLLPLVRQSESEDRVQVLHNRCNRIFRLGIYRSHYRGTLRPVLLHDQSIAGPFIRPAVHPAALVRAWLLLHGSLGLLHHGERPDGLARPIFRSSLLELPPPLDLAVPGTVFRGPTQQLLRLVPRITNLLRHILPRNQTTDQVL